MAGCVLINETAKNESAPRTIERETTEIPFRNVALEDTPPAVRKWVEENKSDEQKNVLIGAGP